MEFVSIGIVLLCMVMIILLIAILRKPVLRYDAAFDMLHERLRKVEDALQSLPHVRMETQEAGESARRSVEELTELRGRLGAFVDSSNHFRRDVMEHDERVLTLLETRLQQGFVGLSDLLEIMRKDVVEHRQELVQATVAMRSELNTTLRQSAESAEKRLEALRTLTEKRLNEMLNQAADGSKNLHDTNLQTIQAISRNLFDMKSGLESVLKSELGAIRVENAGRLEEIRHTVDEKLHSTLEQRLGESFRMVSERLEQVQRGLGEMQTLAAGVGDLKRVLTHVNTQGVWGEVQLEALLEQLLAPEQYAKNVLLSSKSNVLAPFAIRLPGRGGLESSVWLPIAARFPLEDYHRLQKAQEAGDSVAIELAAQQLQEDVCHTAALLRADLLDPPHTTDFAILYVPIEGLYAEILRRPGLADLLQREYKVTVAGPMTLAALLNSLQMGFRTLAIEQRSSEVWGVLGAVKGEFYKFGEALAQTRKKLEEASQSIDSAERRNRVLARKLSSVEVTAPTDAAHLLEDSGN